VRQILWLGCSDSRVPESVVTASRPGDIFVHRNIANQIHPDDDSVLSVITYAVSVVGVEHGTPPSFFNSAENRTYARTQLFSVLVVGHTNCGGAAACLEAATASTPPPEPTTPLARWLAPLTALTGTLDLKDVPASEALTKIVEASVRVQVENVARTAPMKEAWEGGRKNLWVHGLVYELESGTLKDLNITRGPPAA
jgi:carbonic anhydrase